jgi:hypothetical protein
MGAGAVNHSPPARISFNLTMAAMEAQIAAMRRGLLHEHLHSRVVTIEANS